MDGDKAGIARGAKLLDALASKSLVGGRLDTWSKMQDTEGSEYMANASMQGTRCRDTVWGGAAVHAVGGGRDSAPAAAPTGYRIPNLHQPPPPRPAGMLSAGGGGGWIEEAGGRVCIMRSLGETGVTGVTGMTPSNILRQVKPEAQGDRGITTQLKHCIAVPQGAGGTQAKQGAAGVRGVGDEIVDSSRFE